MYYINKSEGSQHPHTYSIENREDVYGESFSNSFGLSLHGGLADLYGFYVELKFVIQNPKQILDVYNYDRQEMRKVEKAINFNALFLGIGYEFSLF